jgi:phosphoribosylformimino-5-aminoimidazole carboxamide ribotide isomerase
MDDLATLAARYGDQLAVGIDARDGLVQVKGWTETSRTTAIELARRAAGAGVRTIIYTDTATDGMLRGPNFDGTADVCDAVGAHCQVIASGGISSADDIRRLRALGKANLTGAIVGKALYEGHVQMADLLAAARA